MLLASFEILSDLKSCSSPESAALEGIFNAGRMQLCQNKNKKYQKTLRHKHTRAHAHTHTLHTHWNKMKLTT